MIGLMDDWEPSKGDPRQYAWSLFPNAFSAIEAAIAQAEGIHLPGNENSCFTITLFAHHSSFRPANLPQEKVRKVKGGFTGAVHIYKSDMRSEEGEYTVDTIEDTVFERIMDQVELLRCRPDVADQLGKD